MGVFTSPIKVKQKIINIKCYIFQDNVFYNLLLGRFCLHYIRETSSILYICLKFENEGKNIIIKVDEKIYEFINMDIIHYKSILEYCSRWLWWAKWLECLAGLIRLQGDKHKRRILMPCITFKWQ